MFFFLSEIPPVVIQYALKPDLSVTHWYDYILFFFYTSFFWFWLLGGFIIWTKKHAYFNCYMYGIVSMALFSAVIFILAPAAPPWYAANEGLIPEVSRVLWNEGGALQSNQFEFVSTYGRNPVAALPSNHVAWPTFTSIWLIFLFGWKRAGWVIIFPLLIAFATWYGGEHYVIDSLAGAVMAGGWFLLTTRIRHPEIPKQVRND
jgi:membrane-associated phospholipid phosphatase